MGRAADNHTDRKDWSNNSQSINIEKETKQSVRKNFLAQDITKFSLYGGLHFCATNHM